MVMEPKTTSKTSCLQALLLRAWRERWTDVQWGINIKTVLPRGVSGDVYNLADCILQQAVIGEGANQLTLSYLRHSLSAQLVSHAAVLQRLSKYKEFTKGHCVFSLLEFLEGMLNGVTCYGKPEETVLATAVLSIVCWLLAILLQCKNSAKIAQKATTLLQIILNDDFYVTLICLARHIDEDLFADTNRKCVELLAGTDADLGKVLSKLENLDVDCMKLEVTTENWPGSLIQCWLEVKLVGNPSASTQSLCDQLRLFQALKDFDSPRLYAELIRGSLLSLYDVNQTSHESQWGAFAFLKIPHVLAELSTKNADRKSENIVDSIELLLQHSPLLDAMDASNSCSSLECLLSELIKVRLLNEGQVKLLLEKRKMPSAANLKLDTAPATAGIPKVIICAEPTLAGILKTLSTDYHKIQDPLLGMLHQVLTGKSFELILAVATVQGQLRTLVQRLIRFNECSKSNGNASTSGNGSTSTATCDKARSQLFDISFLMLVAIVQNYGAPTVLDVKDGNEGNDSLFEHWVRSCMVEKVRPKAPEQLLKLCNPEIVEQLLQQFNSGETDFKTNIKWEDVLFNMSGVMHEVLVAWEQGALLAVDAKRILDTVRGGRMCCLPLAAAAWLCTYMRTAPEESLLKPINMVQQLLSPPTAEDDSLSERWQLTCEIIRKMQRDVQLPMIQKTKSSHHFVSRQPTIEQLHVAWLQAIHSGWLNRKSAKILHCLYDTAGPRWFVNAVVQELLKLRYRDQLQRGIDLALACFHVDIYNCSIELISHILPQLLFNDIQTTTVMEPQLSTLAKLTSFCIYTAYDISLTTQTDDGTEKESQPKVAKLSTGNDSEQILMYLKQLLSMFNDALQDGYLTQQTYFTFYFLRALVEVKVNKTVLKAIPPVLITDLLKTLPELFSYKLLLNLHDINANSGRINMAKDLCILRNYRLRYVTCNE